MSPQAEPFREFLRVLRPELERELGRVLEDAVQSTRRFGAPVTLMVDTLRSLSLAGGKRLRPGLLVAAFRAAAPEAPLAPALKAGVALELFQAYLLIHDDWMDGDTMRRGVPTAHLRLRRHYGSEARGDASAVLVGDYASALAYHTLLSSGAAPAALARAAALLSQVEQEVICGQQLDVAGDSTNPELVYELKTASYTVRAPLLLGCILAGLPEDQLRAMDDFARPLGIAFQLRDDLLALFGDPKNTGRPRGSDLRSGKSTYTVQQAARLATPEDRARLFSVLGHARASDAELGEAIAVLERCGATRATELRITELYTSAMAALSATSFDAASSAVLASAAFALAYREG